MKVYSSKHYSHEEEREGIENEEFAEIIIECSIEELEGLANFFKDELESIMDYLSRTTNESGEAEYFFPHYMFHNKKWKKGMPDIILAVEAK